MARGGGGSSYSKREIAGLCSSGLLQEEKSVPGGGWASSGLPRLG